ncbi:MAG: 2TM domain-containing protein [Ilumatobacter sp.]|uniref:2TM domain-containing protein n=1 Tax=Ilumatobacter sp. TaxID=1967498 RepID=UPI00263033A7|nr:2TM domain-containing protein [Ilumatobacter sp.]MDJ0770478.1 2TM domain-containing protein [Ilumatobacter sp.]
MARSAVELRRGFFVHVLVYVAVSLALVIVTAVRGDDRWWLPFIIIWGVCVVVDGALAFLWGQSGTDGRGLAHWLRVGMLGRTRSRKATTSSGSPKPPLGPMTPHR